MDGDPFLISDSDLSAQDAVDILQLKGSLLDSETNLKSQPQNGKTSQMLKLIEIRTKSIGPIEGLDDGPSLAMIPPFLPAHLNLEIDRTEFTLGDVIGNGTFGTVHVGTLNGTMKKVAVKVLHMKMLGGRQLETFKREVWTMAAVNHPALLHLIGVTLKHPFCLVTELLKCSLCDRLRFLTPTRRSIIAYHISLGMAELHAARVIHRDLKSGNILLDDDDLPRVCDFGLARFQKRGARTGFVGTAQWMAPELLRSSPFYDEKVDVYSFGVLLWELLTLQRPFDGMTQDRLVLGVIDHGLRPAIGPQFGPPRLVALLQQCWAEDPGERPPFEQVAALLRGADCHFVGTNEDEFERAIPDLPAPAELVRAFDAANWQRFDELLARGGADVLEPALALFGGLDDARKCELLRLLPRMVDFEEFLSLKGYFFIVSLFQSSPAVIRELVPLLRTIDRNAMAFRQTKLIGCLAAANDAGALALLADLCACPDIARHVAKHALPFAVRGFDAALLAIYANVLAHAECAPAVAEYDQPFVLARRAIREHTRLATAVLACYPFAERHIDVAISIGLLPELIAAPFRDAAALPAVHRLFVAFPIEVLAGFAPNIAVLVKRFPELAQSEAVAQKLAVVLRNAVAAPASVGSLIDF
jgi:hypothetical protein